MAKFSARLPRFPMEKPRSREQSQLAKDQEVRRDWSGKVGSCKEALGGAEFFASNSLTLNGLNELPEVLLEFLFNLFKQTHHGAYSVKREWSSSFSLDSVKS